MTYKRFPSYYKYKKGTRRNERSTNVKPLTWNFGHIKQHLLKIHCNSNYDTENLSDNESAQNIDEL